MEMPLKEKRKIAAKERTFPLAAFLAGAQKNCYFIYNWGYRMDLGCLEWYPEYARPLGKPLGDMKVDGWQFKSRVRASVRVGRSGDARSDAYNALRRSMSLEGKIAYEIGVRNLL